jgi:hypothetical protein
MKNILFTGALLFVIITASCRGPLAKPGSADKKNQEPVSAGSHMQAARSDKEDIKVEPPQGGISLADLFSEKSKYSGKVVKVRGKVTKVNPAILGKNWIHLQDGTSFEDFYDLTVTSDIIPELGSIITMEGRIALDKDFGHGYTYELLMEEAGIVP